MNNNQKIINEYKQTIVELQSLNKWPDVVETLEESIKQLEN